MSLALNILSLPPEGTEPDKVLYEKELQIKKLLGVDLSVPIPVGEIRGIGTKDDVPDEEFFVYGVYNVPGDPSTKRILALDSNSNPV
jgi:hypothetical protein